MDQIVKQLIADVFFLIGQLLQQSGQEQNTALKQKIAFLGSLFFYFPCHYQGGQYLDRL
jgi:hypothetical protein